MNARRKLIAALSEDSMGGIATLSDVEHAEQLVDAFRAEVLNEAAAILQDRAAQYPTRRIFAAGLRHGALRLAKEAMGRTSPADADFFQPGHTYVCAYGTSTIRFFVRYIDDSPEGIPYRVAFGWKSEDGDVCASPFDSDDFTGWTDVTEGVSR